MKNRVSPWSVARFVFRLALSANPAKRAFGMAAILLDHVAPNVSPLLPRSSGNAAAEGA